VIFILDRLATIAEFLRSRQVGRSSSASEESCGMTAQERLSRIEKKF
jgi:hypothetical protein